MFTGIIQYVGRLERTTSTSAGRRLRVEAAPLAARTANGGSIAVNGACQTVAAVDGGSVEFDAVAETLRRTTLGSLTAGARVNLEAALRVGDGLDGHLVQGHVDGVGRLERIDRGGGQHVMSFTAEPGLTDAMVAKGSVAIDGVSLTLVDVDGGRFSVALIPTTLAETTLGSLRVGDAVNVETDILGKYVRRRMAPREGGAGVTLAQLRKAGFA
ncbi:MAG: riboflavin synthase [Planctomycetota bacterium]